MNELAEYGRMRGWLARQEMKHCRWTAPVAPPKTLPAALEEFKEYELMEPEEIEFCADFFMQGWLNG